MDPARKTELLERCVAALFAEREGQAPAVPKDDEGLWTTFRALVNTRPPLPASETFLADQDELLRGLIEEEGVASPADAAASSAGGRLSLWRGDITTFAADAIVNAANSQMLGCWVPGHHCIDNAIHTFAGVQLRIECAQIMDAQGHDEPTGQAKVTGAYNLPARWVVHTVGPIAAGSPTDLHRMQLASCYTSCLDAAASVGARSIAFCCISTGVFGFPPDEAAPCAISAVRGWLERRPETDIQVVFNVFSDADERLYRGLLDLGA